MEALTFADVRRDLEDVMERVVQDHTPIVVTRHEAEAVVMVSLADWNAMEETARLLGSPNSAARLAEAIAQLDGRATASGSD